MRRRHLLHRFLTLLLGRAAAAASANATLPQQRIRYILCLLGPTGWLPTAARRIAEFGQGFTLDREFSLETHDERMPASFGASWNQVPPSHLDADRATLHEHGSVAYVLSPAVRPGHAVATGAQALRLIDELIADGALACKCDSAGIAHGARRWRQLAGRLRAAAPAEHAAILYQAFVRRPISDEGILYSCGMHLLACPDIEYIGPRDTLAATAIIDRTARAVLAGQPLDLPHHRNLRYAGDFFFDNPWGYLRVDETEG